MASFQDRAQHAVAQLDKELSKYPLLNNLERQSSVPKVYVVLGLVGVYFFLVFFNIAGEFLVNLAGFIIPAYYSLNALFTTTTVDDTQWLTVCRVLRWIITVLYSVLIACVRADEPSLPPPSQTAWYWVVYALFTVVESAISAPYWFPFYYIFKFALILWMALPQTGGAQVVFHSFLQPVLGRFFSSGSTSANLRAQADAATKSQ